MNDRVPMAIPHGWERLLDDRLQRPLPLMPDYERPWWEAARQRCVVVQRCSSCERPRFPLSPICPWCLSRKVTWTSSDGIGVVRSYATYQSAFHPWFESLIPYTIGWVGLPEGVAIPTMFVDIDCREVFVGMEVRARFEDITDEVTIVRFGPR